MPSGSAWLFRGSSIEQKGTYFQPGEWEEQPRLKPEAYYQQLREVFSQNLPRYFNGQEQIGMSLTGGLDTRLIMAWRKAASESLPCYTFGGMFRDCQDVVLARRVAKVCRQPHEVIKVGDEFLFRFPHYAERSVYLTDACVDVSRSPDLYVQERAREIAPVRIAGTYGSEIVSQAVMFKPGEALSGLFCPEILSCVACTPSLLLLSVNPLGITTEFSRWNRLSSPYALHTSTTILSEWSSVPRVAALRAATFVCG